MSKLAEIKELLAAVTPEPWVAVARHGDNDGTQDEMSGLGWDIEGPPQPMRGQFSRCADAKFAAHSPEYVALLVAVVEAVRKHWTPASMAEAARTTAWHMAGKEREEWEKLAVAWEGIA